MLTFNWFILYVYFSLIPICLSLTLDCRSNYPRMVSESRIEYQNNEAEG